MSYPPEQVIADMIILIRKQERQATEERIIKLLEEHFDNPEGCPCVLCWNFAGTELMTALIKGENK